MTQSPEPVPATVSVKPPVAAQFALGFICTVLLFAVLYVGRNIFVPLMIAVCFWYLINALARGIALVHLGGKKVPRLLCFVLSIAAMLFSLWIIIALISSNIASVLTAAPAYRDNFDAIIPRLMALLGVSEQPSIGAVLAYFNPGAFIGYVAQMFTGLAGKTLIIVFYTGFLLYEQQFFKRKISMMLEDARTERRVTMILRTIDLQMQRYIAVKTFISAMTGLFTYAVLAYQGVDFAEFWGLMAFVLNFIPYVGSLVAIVLPGLISLIQFGDISIALSVIAALSLVQIVWGSIIDPRMMGDSLNLSPIAIILSLGIWGTLWGVPGMLLSIPILAMLVVTLSQFPMTRPIAILLTKTGDVTVSDA